MSEVGKTLTTDGARKFIRSYDDLDVYQRSMAALRPLHRAVLNFPDYEKFDLANQMRRACKSVPANIAEGYGKRRSPKEFKSFLTNAMGSAMEMETHLKIAHELAYLTDEIFEDLIERYFIIGRQLYRLIEHWRLTDARPPTSDLPLPEERSQ